MEGKKRTEALPASLQKFLTVTEPDGKAKTEKVGPSPLLAQLEAFLPQMAAANDALKQKTESESAVEVERAGLEAERADEGSKQGDTRVNMDLYVDESLGELVGANSKEDKQADSDKEEKPSPKKQPLIEVLEEKT